jgi:hypothetical protein
MTSSYFFFFQQTGAGDMTSDYEKPELQDVDGAPNKDRCITGDTGGHNVCSKGSGVSNAEANKDRCISGSTGGSGVCSTGSNGK